MRVLVCSARAPFEVTSRHDQADLLAAALRERGHEVDVVRLPLAAGDAEAAHHLAFRLTGLGHPDSTLIALDANSALVDHPRKILWLTGDGAGPSVERLAIAEAAHVFAPAGVADPLAGRIGASIERLDVPGPSDSWGPVVEQLLAA